MEVKSDHLQLHQLLVCYTFFFASDTASDPVGRSDLALDPGGRQLPQHSSQQSRFAECGLRCLNRDRFWSFVTTRVNSTKTCRSYVTNSLVLSQRPDLISEIDNSVKISSPRIIQRNPQMVGCDLADVLFSFGVCLVPEYTGFLFFPLSVALEIEPNIFSLRYIPRLIFYFEVGFC